MLENELFLIVAFEHDGIFVERPDLAGEFHSAKEVNRDGRLILARRIQERILDVLRRLCVHFCRSPYSSLAAT
jgi:hypothetical protein